MLVYDEKFLSLGGSPDSALHAPRSPSPEEKPLRALTPQGMVTVVCNILLWFLLDNRFM